VRKVIALVVGLLLLPPSVPAAGAREAVLDSTRRKTEAIPTGTLIEVRLNNNQKLRGRRGEVSQDSFILAGALPAQSSQAVPGETASDQKIAFTDVRSVNQVRVHTARNVLIGVGIGIGILMVISAILVHTTRLG
jgi:hypothetical protein